MEKLISFFEMAAPGIQIRVDQTERLVGPADGKFEKVLGLLLGCQVADCLHVGVISAGIGGWHKSGRLNRVGRQRRSSVEPPCSSNFKARDLITSGGGSGGEHDQH
jgi:hypothetical protein